MARLGEAIKKLWLMCALYLSILFLFVNCESRGYDILKSDNFLLICGQHYVGRRPC